MAGELLLINPRRRRHKRRKMSALQRRYFGKRRKRTYARRNPRRRRSVAALAVSRPARRTRRYKRRSFRSRFKSFRSSNPVRSLSGFVSQKIVPASVGAAGALAVDMAWGHIPLPTFLSTGPLAPVARIALSVAVGYGLGMVFGKKFGEEATNGAIIATLYDLGKTQISAAWPGAVSGYVDGYVSQGYLPGPGEEYEIPMEYMSGLSYVSPAPIVG